MASLATNEAASTHFSTGTKITINARESAFFDTLLRAVASKKSGTTIRCAGGWVRDKLLGLDSDDIDLAVDNMSGLQFAELLKEYLEEQWSLSAVSSSTQIESPPPTNVDAQSTIKVAVIKANPDQSKHLETATVKIAGLEVDITNLRTETYAEGSRIPTIEIGTAREDAYRRDLTINSLFYNINETKVEDFTGHGLKDLLPHSFGAVNCDGKTGGDQCLGICRCPLPAQETFLDDPLRLLRAVRFAIRFRFRLDGDIIAAASDPKIWDAFSTKVTRERCGKEIEGMLTGRNAILPAALRILYDIGILVPLVFLDLPVVLSDPDSNIGGDNMGRGPWIGMLETLEWLHLILNSKGGLAGKHNTFRSAIFQSDVDGITNSENNDEGRCRIAMLAGTMLPFTGKVIMTGKKKDKPVAAAQHILVESLKMKNRDCSDSSAIVNAVAKMRALVTRNYETSTPCLGKASSNVGENRPSLRLEIGLLLRKLKDLWKPCLALACAVHLQEVFGRPLAFTSMTADGNDKKLAPFDFEGKLEVLPREVQDQWRHMSDVVYDQFAAFSNAVNSMGLSNVATLRPLLNGKEIQELLNLPNGPAVGEATATAMRWQIDHPAGTKEELREHLQLPVIADELHAMAEQKKRPPKK